jgi:mannosyltransferase
MTWFRNRPSSFYLALLVLLALALRGPNLGRDSLWFDEAISYLTAQLPLARILDNTVQSSHPPFYYLLLSVWQGVVPLTDAALRLFGVVWDLLLVVAVHSLAAALLGRKRVALLAALLVAISPFHILYSHELRMYTLVMLLVTAGAYAYWRARPSRGWRGWLAMAALFFVAVYSHLFAFLALAGIGIHALLERHNRRALWRTGIATALVCLAFVPWAVTMANESQSDLGSLRPLHPETLNPIKPLSAPAFLLFGQTYRPLVVGGLDARPVYTGVILFLSLAMAVVFLMELRRLRREGAPPGLTLILLIAGFVLFGPVTVYMLRPYFLPERTMAAASPFLLIWLAWATTRRQSPLPYLVGAAAVFMVVGAILYHSGGPIKPPYREAIRFIAANRAEGDAIVHTSDGSYLPALRYERLPQHALLAGDPDPRKPEPVYRSVGGQIWTREEALTRGERLWLVVALEHSVAWQQEQAAYFRENLHEVALHDYGGIAIILYEHE